MKSNTHKIMTIACAVISALLASCKIREASKIISIFNWIKALLFFAGCCALNRNWTDAENEREVCVCVRALWKQDLALRRQYWAILRLNKAWMLFWMEKKSLKGSAKSLSWQHCISISPIMGWATQGRSQRTGLAGTGPPTFCIGPPSYYKKIFYLFNYCYCIALNIITNMNSLCHLKSYNNTIWFLVGYAWWIWLTSVLSG